jgi:TMEM175 potassium channel family protein
MISNETGRVDAFSDGVFTIAISLLVFEIKVPERSEHGLWHDLALQWPSYTAYVVTFLVIGIMWVNHHTMFGFIGRVDRPILFLNLALLMTVAVLPWPTAMMAEYLRAGDDSHAAAAVYSLVMMLHSFCYQALWWHLTRSGHLFDDRVDIPAARALRKRFALGSVVYPLTVALAFISALATLVVLAAMALYYAFNQLPVPLKENSTANLP